ncbi:MAG TPA: C25 family cysteine peptidase [candidate division Zixibacteria bacterium]|nr:C25 family cysteine peptidase [candidate division Zixibacteria bacterium]
MTRRIVCLLLVLSAAMAMLLLPQLNIKSLSAGLADNRPSPNQEFSVEDLVFSDYGLEFSLRSGVFAVDNDGQLTAQGLNTRTQEPGAPSVPYFSTWIVLPPGAGIEVNVISPNWIETDPVEIRTLKGIEFSGATLEGNIDIPGVSEKTLLSESMPTANEQDAFYPRELFEYSEPMYLRDIRVVRLSIYPIRYNPVQRHTLTADQVDVSIVFTNVDSPVSNLAPSYDDAHSRTIASQAMNWDQAMSWRGLPEALPRLLTQLPLGVDVFKISVDKDAIYKLGYSELQEAGMDVDNVDPTTFEMLYRGQPVSYSFVGNDDTTFQPGEYLLFYGWAFDGSRLEKQFITDNVYWLWAGGTPSRIVEMDSVPGEEIHSFVNTVTREPENVWYASWTDRWDLFPNQPDAWYWERFTKGTVLPLTHTYDITLPYPMPVGQDAVVTAEFTSKYSPEVGGNPIPHIARVHLNGNSNFGSEEWYGVQNVNITATVPITSLLNGINHIDAVHATNTSIGNNTAIYLNRLTVEYEQQFIAGDDQLAFAVGIEGAKEFNIGGFGTGIHSDILAWDVSDNLSPVSIITNSISITGTGPFTYSFGTDQAPGTTFIVTTSSNVIDPKNIKRLVLEDIQPEFPGADWIAISYSGFITEVQRLENHRGDPTFGSLTTHVVDVESVVDQYGYGLPLPSGIQAFMIEAMVTWVHPPSYLLLVGDSTINPKNNLNLGSAFFAPQYVPTDLVFADRFQGQIPSDHVYSLLVGSDLLPDISVGRIPATSEEDLAAVIDKIIAFELNQLLPADWMQNIIFLSDDYDSSAGNFCLENQFVGQHVPDVFNKIELCLPDNPSISDVEILRTQFFSYTNMVGTSFVNYRGHGALQSWGGAPQAIVDTSHVDNWANSTKPVIIMTGDCLDGFFAYPQTEGLAETFLRTSNGGSAGHWSSSGLGFSIEHSAIVENFYDAFFLDGVTALGDAATAAKIHFYQNGGHRSIVYSFILEGDPAMQMMRPALSIEKNTTASIVERGDIIDYSLEISNIGVYPSHVIVTDTLPVGMNYISSTSSIPATVLNVGNDIIFDLQFDEPERNKGLPRDTTAVITLTVEVGETSTGGAYTNFAQVGGTGLEAWPGNESDFASVFIYYDVFIPSLFNE